MKAKNIRAKIKQAENIFLYAPMFEKYCKVSAKAVLTMMEGIPANQETNANVQDSPYSDGSVFIEFEY